jgi:hypothetical protein
VAYLGGRVHVDLEGGTLESLDGDLHGGEARQRPLRRVVLESSGEGERGGRERRRWGRNPEERLGPLAFLGLGICTNGPLRFFLIPLRSSLHQELYGFITTFRA